MRYYYTYTITRGTITQIGVDSRDKITKHITPDNLCNIKILFCHENYADAVKAAINKAGSLGLPLLPMSAVVCNETGDIFPNAEKAAEWIDTDKGNMSRHLKGIGSWKTLRGRTFRYVSRI